MTHMDESYFPNPSNFDPETQASTPGSRICPGNEFVRIGTLVTIHHLVTHFTWKMCCMDTSFSRNSFPVFKRGLQIQTKPKNRACQIISSRLYRLITELTTILS